MTAAVNVSGDDGGGQCLGRIAGVDVAVIVRMELALGFQCGQYAVAEQLACLQVYCTTAVNIAEDELLKDVHHFRIRALSGKSLPHLRCGSSPVHETTGKCSSLCIKT